MAEERRDPVMVLCGRWKSTKDGAWIFDVDKKQMGRCVNIGSETKTYNELVKSVQKEFGVDVDDIPLLSYWIQGPVAIYGGRLNPPVLFSSDEGYENFRAKRMEDKTLSLFVKFGSGPQSCTTVDDTVHPSKGVSSSYRSPVNGQVMATHGSSSEAFGEPLISPYIPNNTTSDFVFDDPDRVIRLADDCNMDFGDKEGGSDEEASDEDDEPASDAEFEEDGEPSSEVADDDDGEEIDYPFDHWQEQINKEFEDNLDNLRVPGDVQTQEVVQESTEMMGTYIPVSLENIFEEVRDDAGVFAVDAPPVFDEFDEEERTLGDVDMSNADDYLYKGRTFKNKEQCQTTLAIYAIKRLFHFKQKISTTKKLTFLCVDPKCDWYVMALRAPNSDYFEIKTAVLEHRCTMSSREQYTKHATAKVVSQLMRSKYGVNGSGPKPRELTDLVMQEIGVTMSYWKAWRTRELSLDLTQGSAEGSFTLLPSYLYLLKKYNPGTIANLETVPLPDGVNRFKYLFLSMGASLNGSWYLRRVVVVDGTHLTGKFKGCMLTASMQDGNFQIFPIAFAVVDSENDASWNWFFNQLKSVLGRRKELYFVSDRHASIRKGIANVFPSARHGCCHVHLERNVSAAYKSKGLSKLVGRAARAYRLVEFNELFIEVEGRSKTCGKYLRDIGFAHWSRAHAVGDRYNIMSSNVAESLNAVLHRAKGFPIVSMIDYIRTVMMRWFSMRRTVQSKHQSKVTPNVDKHLVHMMEKPRSYTVGLSTVWGIELHGSNGSKYNVNLDQRTCSCQVYDKLQLPCRHALAAGRHKAMQTVDLVGPYYSMDVWKSAYKGDLAPVPQVTDEMLPEDVKSYKLIHPQTKQPPGRPRSERIASTGEYGYSGKKSKSTNRCGRCGGTGHNRTTCKNPID